MTPQAHAFKRAKEEGLVFVAPYDDPYTVAGQGTIGDEIRRQVGGIACIAAAVDGELNLERCLYHGGRWVRPCICWCMGVTSWAASVRQHICLF